MIACLPGLTPSKTATYAVSGDGDRREGVVRAQPRWSRPADAQNIEIGSCFFLANPSYGVPEKPGIFGRARFGDVDIFLFADRY